MLGGMLVIFAKALWKFTDKALLGGVVALEVHARYGMRVERPSLFGKVRIEDQ